MTNGLWETVSFVSPDPQCSLQLPPQEHWGSWGNKTHCFPWSQSLSAYETWKIARVHVWSMLRMEDWKVLLIQQSSGVIRFTAKQKTFTCTHASSPWTKVRKPLKMVKYFQLTCSLGTCAISNSLCFPSYSMSVPPCARKKAIIIIITVIVFNVIIIRFTVGQIV